MQKKYLLIDIGNSNTVYAEYQDKIILEPKIIATYNLEQEFIKLDFTQYHKIIISSVVPLKDRFFQSYSNIHCVTYQNIPKLKLNLQNPEQIGADRLVNALSAYELVQGSVLIIDSGTATTLCYVDSGGTYQGGIIIPGFGLMSKSLNDYTAKIPLIWVESSEKLYGKTTKEAVQIGLYKTAIYTLKGFIQSYKSKYPSIKVVATGTGLKIIKTHIPIDHYDPNLILKGLAIIAKNF